MGKMSTPRGSRSSPAGLGTLGPVGRGCRAPSAGRGVPGARVRGGATSRRLANSEVKAAWAGGLSVGAWARRRAPPSWPDASAWHRPWARGFERPVADVASLHSRKPLHRARTTRQDASSARGAPDPVRSRALNEGAARSVMGRPRQRAVAPASGRPRATDCPPFPRSATHLRVGLSPSRGSPLFCIRARGHSARSTRAARTASRGFARAIARPRCTRRIALR
jgi:hypothetical protein